MWLIVTFDIFKKLGFLAFYSNINLALTTSEIAWGQHLQKNSRIFLLKEEYFRSLHAFLKKEEAEANFPGSQNNWDFIF